MAYDLTGKRALVTGGSSGIGEGLAEALAAHGAVVGICGRRKDRLEVVTERCRSLTAGAECWVTDLAQPGAPEALAADVLEQFGRIDLLVNNAGIPKRRHVRALDGATVDSVMQINFLAGAHLTLALLPQMLERGDGRVVSISSVAARLSSPGEAAYSASKAALAAFTETLALDLWNTGVRAMTVYPGVVDTDLFTAPDNDPPVGGVEAITVSEAARAILDGLVSDAVELYVPAWFDSIVATKIGDLASFLDGAATWVQSRAAP